MKVVYIYLRLLQRKKTTYSNYLDFFLHSSCIYSIYSNSFESEPPVCIMNTTTAGFLEMNSLTLTRLVSTLYILLALCFDPGVARYRGLCQERDWE